MRCSLPHLWLGIGVVTSLLTGGCQNSRQCSSTCTYPPTPTAAVAYKPPKRAPVPAAKPADESAALPIRNDSTVLHTTAKPAPTALDAAPRQLPASAVFASERGSAAKTAPVEDSTPRAANADVTTQPCFAHDPNYHRLVGVLEYSKIQDAWILRYASVEEEDRYGGSVTLHGSGPMNAFKSRQVVRVEGRLINPDSQQIRPAFQVESIHPSEQ